MTQEPLYGAGLWHFAQYVDPFNPPGLPVSQVAEALARNGLGAVGITPEIYTREFCRGAFTNPDPAVRARTFDLVSEAAGIARELGCDYVKLWPGQDGHDYPFQVDHGQIWSYAVTGLRPWLRPIRT